MHYQEPDQALTGEELMALIAAVRVMVSIGIRQEEVQPHYLEYLQSALTKLQNLAKA